MSFNFGGIDPSSKHHISDQILEYYHKFGQNRDLEKYLRLRQNYSKSSSDGSISNHPVHCLTSKLGKSLENLSLLKSNIKDKSDEILVEKKDETPVKEIEEEAAAPVKDEKTKLVKNIKIKSDDSKKGDKKSKSFNFNVESTIEISMPPPPVPQIQTLPSTSDHDEQKFQSFIKYLQSTETQTQSLELKKPDEPDFESPIKPVTSQNLSKDEIPENIRTLSPASSVTSNKNKLEWDSMADVGYEKSGKIENFSAISSLERNALKKFFAQRGFNFDESIILIAQQTPIKPAEENKKSELVKKSSTQKFIADFSTNPEAQSTPKSIIVQEKSKGAIPKNTNQIYFSNKKMSELIEKSAQTSLVDLSSKATQASIEQTIQTEKSQEIDSSEDDFKEATGRSEFTQTATNEEITVTDSFEFLSVGDYLKGNESNTNKVVENDQEIVVEEEEVVVVKSETIRPRNTSLQTDFQIGIDLMNSLVESNRMPLETKKKLIKKIVKTLVKTKYSDDSSSLSSVLGKSSFSISSHSEHRSSKNIEPTIEEMSKKDITAQEQKSNKSENSSKNSEISKIENSDFSKTSSSRHSTLATKLPLTDKSASTSKSSSKSEKPISTSIQQATMKDWLEPLTHSEMDYEIHQSLKKNKEEKILSEQKLIEEKLIKLQIENDEESSLDNDRQKRLNWIETEIKHLENLKNLLEKEKSMKEKIDLLTKNMPEDKIFYENIKKKSEPISDRREPMELPVNNNSWNSHKNMEKIIRNRSKLETPSTNDDSFRNFVSERKQNFIKKYEKEHGQFYDDSKNLYTKPYSDHYSEPNENKKKPPKFIYAKHTTNASTSINSSEFFLSSNSISIPIISTASNTTNSSSRNFRGTGREYGTQTSDSMTRTNPIFENQISSKKTKTSMIDKSKNHKQQQVRPLPIAYLLTFDSNEIGSSLGSSYGKKSSKLEQEKVPEKENKKRIIEEVKMKIPKIVKENISEETTDSDDSSVISQKLSLQGNLLKNRPDFLSKAEERRKCVAQLNKLRKKRNEQRKKLLLLTSETSLLARLEKLPPPPLSQQRVFNTKTLLARTKKQYNQLPEVLRKKEVEKLNKLKKGNRIVMEMFNKNLQRKTLKGQTSLSNSFNVV